MIAGGLIKRPLHDPQRSILFQNFILAYKEGVFTAVQNGTFVIGDPYVKERDMLSRLKLHGLAVDIFGIGCGQKVVEITGDRGHKITAHAGGGACRGVGKSR